MQKIHSKKFCGSFTKTEESSFFIRSERPFSKREKQKRMQKRKVTEKMVVTKDSERKLFLFPKDSFLSLFHIKIRKRESKKRTAFVKGKFHSLKVKAPEDGAKRGGRIKKRKTREKITILQI